MEWVLPATWNVSFWLVFKRFCTGHHAEQCSLGYDQDAMSDGTCVNAGTCTTLLQLGCISIFDLHRWASQCYC